jgi:hypothetical protein
LPTDTKSWQVPKIVINDRISFEGALPEALFVEHVLAALRG